jgi:YD repeat-containing protein
MASSGGLPVSGNTPTSNVYNAQNQINGASYDAVGNQTVVNGNTIGYDAENRQVQMSEPLSLGGAQATYQYDGAGQRVLRT